MPAIFKSEVPGIPVPESQPAGSAEATHQRDPDTLSVVMRFHAPERLPFLEEALFSLAAQSWPTLEIILAVQNGSEQLIHEITRIACPQPWPGRPKAQIFSVPVEAGADGRSRLLNAGVARATGRYLAFLDDDDVMYQHGYTTLIGRLRATDAAVAVGGSRVAKMHRVSSHWFVVFKEPHFSWGECQEDLFTDNFVPIHSYVIDRTRIAQEHLYFDESLSLLEDYDFLLRLAAAYHFDFEAIRIPVCEYRIRLDGSNSIPFENNMFVTTPELQRAREEISRRKKHLLCAVPASELARLRACLRPSPTATPMEPEHFVFKTAQKMHAFFVDHPRLESQCGRLAHWTWRRYKRLRAFFSTGRSESGL